MKQLVNRFLFLAVLCIPALFACSKEEPEARDEIISAEDGMENPSEEEEPEIVYTGPVFSTELEGVKSYLDSGRTPCWETGDVIGVTTSDDANVACVLVNQAKGDFAAGDISGSQPYYAVYPYNEDNTFNTGTNTLSATVPELQKLTDVTQRVAPGALVAACKSSTKVLAFKNCVSLMQLSIGIANKVHKVKVEANSGAKLSGPFTAAVTEESLTSITAGGDATNTVYLEAPDGMTFQIGTYYIAVLPGSITSVRFDFYDLDGKSVNISKTASATFARNSGINMGSFFSWEINDEADFINWRMQASKYTPWDVVNLNADLDLTSYRVGDSDGRYGEVMKFAGIFNGNNHTISGLIYPLFGNLFGSVKDLTINANVSFEGNWVREDTIWERPKEHRPCNGTDYGFGLLAHFLYLQSDDQSDYKNMTGKSPDSEISISNVTVRGSLTVNHLKRWITPLLDEPGWKDLNHKLYVGGLAGASNGVPLTDCKNYANVTLTDLKFYYTADEGYREDSWEQVARLAGVVAQFGIAPVTCRRCENHGKITANGTYDERDTLTISIGGVFGHSAYGSTFEQCINGSSSAVDSPTDGAISVDFWNSQSVHLYIGGFMGSSNNSVVLTECKNYGRVQNSVLKKTGGADDATDRFRANVGGLVGGLTHFIHYDKERHEVSQIDFYTPKLTDCENRGSVTDACNTGSYCMAEKGSVHRIGGLVGYLVGKDPTNKDNPDVFLKDCANSGAVSCQSPVADSLYLAGITGFGDRYTKYEACANTGAVSITSALTSNSKKQYLAGVLAIAEHGARMYQCTNNAAITNNAVPSTSVVDLAAGGIVGVACKYSKLISCENQDDASLQSNVPARTCFLGGILGHTLKGSLVDRCINSGTVSQTGNIIIYLRVGGVIGNFVCGKDTDEVDSPQSAPYGTVTYCENYGSVSNTFSTDLTLYEKDPYIGGVMGGSTTGATYVENCVSQCTVSHTQTSGTLSTLCIGGLTGYMGNQYGRIIGNAMNCTVSITGTVTTKYPAMDIGYLAPITNFRVEDNKYKGEVTGTTLNNTIGTSGYYVNFMVPNHPANPSYTFKDNVYWN